MQTSGEGGATSRCQADGMSTKSSRCPAHACVPSACLPEVEAGVDSSFETIAPQKPVTQEARAA